MHRLRPREGIRLENAARDAKRWEQADCRLGERGTGQQIHNCPLSIPCSGKRSVQSRIRGSPQGPPPLLLYRARPLRRIPKGRRFPNFRQGARPGGSLRFASPGLCDKLETGERIGDSAKSGPWRESWRPDCRSPEPERARETILESSSVVTEAAGGLGVERFPCRPQAGRTRGTGILPAVRFGFHPVFYRIGGNVNPRLK